jgi:hypothetical protein
VWHCCVHHADEFIRRVTDIAVTVEAWKTAREFMSVPFSEPFREVPIPDQQV